MGEEEKTNGTDEVLLSKMPEKGFWRKVITKIGDDWTSRKFLFFMVSTIAFFTGSMSENGFLIAGGLYIGANIVGNIASSMTGAVGKKIEGRKDIPRDML